MLLKLIQPFQFPVFDFKSGPHIPAGVWAAVLAVVVLCIIGAFLATFKNDDDEKD